MCRLSKRPAKPHRPVCGTLSQNGYGNVPQQPFVLIANYITGLMFLVAWFNVKFAQHKITGLTFLLFWFASKFLPHCVRSVINRIDKQVCNSACLIAGMCSSISLNQSGNSILEQRLQKQSGVVAARFCLEQVKYMEGKFTHSTKHKHVLVARSILWGRVWSWRCIQVQEVQGFHFSGSQGSCLTSHATHKIQNV